MILGFIKKLVKYYIDKLVSWLRIKKLQLELDNEIKKYHDDLDKKIDEIGKVTGLFTKEEVLSLSDYEKSLIITAEYFESINATGEVLINSQ